MPRFIKRPEAEKDLDDIWWFVGQDNPDNADKLINRIEDKCRMLLQFPELGVSR